jgi:hypothetical protein
LNKDGEKLALDLDVKDNSGPEDLALGKKNRLALSRRVRVNMGIHKVFH